MSEPPKPQSVIVIDDDPTIGSIVTQILNQNGMPNVLAMDHGQSAWDAMRRDRFDFIILDWKLPDITGVAFLNRIRQDKYYYKIPVLISSGFLKAKDFSLLHEFLLTGEMEKPIQKGFLLRKINELYLEGKWFHSKEEMLFKLFQQLREDPEASLHAIEKILKESQNPLPLGVAAARLLIDAKHYPQAETILRSILQKFPDSVVVLNELGKLKLLMKSYDEAKRILLKAHKNSPDNTERLNMLGNVSLQKMELNEAQGFFDRALEIDPYSKSASSGKKVVDNINQFLGQAGSEALPRSFASLLNAIGITFVKNKEFDKGIEHYRSALGHIQDPLLKAKLAFNAGLGYLRWRKPEDALSWFNKSVEFSPGFDRSKEFITKLEKQLAEQRVADEAGAIRAEATPSIDDLANDKGDLIPEMPIPIGEPTLKDDSDVGEEEESDGTDDLLDESLEELGEDEYFNVNEAKNPTDH